MKNVFLYLLVVVTIIALYGVAYAGMPEEPAGKKLFIDSKCNMCHGVQSAAIETKSKKKDIPDLSGVGSHRKADFLKKYLLKQEKVNDKNHPATFKGSDADLAKLVEWLGTLKEAKK
ncbi:MAG: cytochrome c [Ignavibacteriales bacterium]|nr:cytochrome c [Ignavibacteriales bacterium]